MTTSKRMTAEWEQKTGKTKGKHVQKDRHFLQKPRDNRKKGL